MQVDTLQVAEQAQEVVANVVVESNEVAANVAPQLIEGWGDMLLVAAIGFGVVFAVLVLLIYVMRFMGWVFTRQKKAAKAATTGAVVADDDNDAISDQEIAAAIMTALKLYKSNLHDQESEMITIHRIARAYSPWSSKIHGLTQLPERK